ncbi:hypothetical protein ACFZDG_35790 [Kitasatospora xanthocidica]|uniref:hypothetical protein n=1 Tax=Kitasatospora xanthocidica TaxID=83382 RepID=UPI0036E91C5E
MADTARARGLAGAGGLGPWSEEDIGRYESARDRLTTAISTYADLLVAETSPSRRENVRAAYLRYVELRRQLAVDDKEKITEILASIPGDGS